MKEELDALSKNHCKRLRPPTRFWMLGQTHVNGWSRVTASQNEGSTNFILPFRLNNGVATYLIIRINKKTKIEKFLILLICN